MSGKKYKVHFGTMHCVGKEDASYDEIRIRRWVDGNRKYPDLRWKVHENDEYKHFDVYAEFDKGFSMQVYEDDLGVFPDPHDYIGEVYITGENIDEEFVSMNPLGRGFYTLTWTNLTKHYDDHARNKPERPAASAVKASKADVDRARKGHRALSDHINQGNRKQDIHNTMIKAIHTFKNPDATKKEKSDIVTKLKSAFGTELSPIRGIINDVVGEGAKPTVLLYGPAFSIDLGFASLGMAYGFGLQLDGKGSALFLDFSFERELFPGSDGTIAIGINRNEIPGVAGLTYGVTMPADAEITGGITLSFDGVVGIPNVQEITYTFGGEGVPLAAGFAYTVMV